LPNLSRQRAFLRCRDCRAWVDHRAEQCPLCGIAWPTSPWLTWRQENGLSWRDLAATLGAVTGLISGLLLWQFWQHAIRYGTPGPLRFLILVAATGIAWALGRALTTPRTAFFLACGALAVAMPVVLHAQTLLNFPDGLIGTALVLGLGLFGWLAGRIFGPSLAAEHWERRQAHNVVTMLATLQQRLVDLQESREKMVALGLRLSEQLPGEAQHPALVTLRTSIHATDAQYHSHVVHGWQFATAIWQNQAQPILAQWRHFNAREAEAAVAALDKMTRDGEKLVGTWQEAPQAADPRGQRAIVQQQRLLAAVAQLRQAVLLRQATALAQATPGIREAFDSASLPGAALTEIDELRQGARFLELTGPATELLAENERLRAEQAAIQEVEKLVG
jgi:hypothetical protein